MLVGKALAGGHGLIYQGVVDAPPAAKFPPGYPALLAVLWLTLRNIGTVTLVATVLNVTLLAAGAGLFAKALRDSAGLSTRMSVAAAGLGFACTDLVRTALVPLSESLFVFLMMAAFATWAAAIQDEGRKARGILAALLVAVVATRSAGLALVLAFALGLFMRRGVVSALSVTTPALATVAAWSWWSGAKVEQIPQGTRDLLGPYGSWLADQTLAAPGTFFAGLPSHALGVMERVALLFLPGFTGWPLLLAALPAAVIACIGLGRAFRAFPPLAWLLPAYVGMLMLWPYLDRRLLVPIHPVVMAMVALGASSLLEHLKDVKTRAVLVGTAALWVCSYSVVTAARIGSDWPVAPYRLRAERLATAVEALNRTIQPDEVVGAPEFWAALHLHGGWTVAPSVRFDPRSVDPEAPMWGTPDEQIALWRDNAIDVLLLEQAGRLHGAALDQLEAECPGSAFVLAQMPSTMVVRLDRTAPCS